MGSRLDQILVLDGMIQFDLFVHVDSPLLACSLVFLFVIVLGSFRVSKMEQKKQGFLVSMWPRSRGVIDRGLRRQAARGRRNWNGGCQLGVMSPGKRVRADAFCGEEGPVLLQSGSDGEGTLKKK
jgi:hypothetical protein